MRPWLARMLWRSAKTCSAKSAGPPCCPHSNCAQNSWTPAEAISGLASSARRRCGWTRALRRQPGRCSARWSGSPSSAALGRRPRMGSAPPSKPGLVRLRRAQAPGIAAMGDLLARAFTEQALLDAWESVRESALADGIAGPEVERFEAAAARQISGLAESLADGTFTPGPLAPIEIAKSGGGTRHLEVPSLV